MAYELQIPTSSLIHPVFLVSKLRRYYGEDKRKDLVHIPEDLKGGTLLDEGLFNLDDMQDTTGSDEREKDTQIREDLVEIKDTTQNSLEEGEVSFKIQKDTFL